MPSVPQNILLIDKPKGITSFDCIRRLRKKLGIRKMGHAGTLDPLASGLLIIGVGEGTKLLGDFLKLPKTYEAEILLGTKTDSGDLEGKIIEEKDASDISEKKAEKAVSEFRGTFEIAVPMYSAVKVGGIPLYKIARKISSGETLSKKEFETQAPVKSMTVDFAKFVSFAKKGEKSICTVIFGVSSGSYIRALAEEFGARMGVPATLANLRRLSIGDWDVRDAETL